MGFGGVFGVLFAAVGKKIPRQEQNQNQNKR